jgi:hypothetical protein
MFHKYRLLCHVLFQTTNSWDTECIMLWIKEQQSDTTERVLMIYITQNKWVSGHPETTRFRKLDRASSSDEGKETPNLLGLKERANSITGQPMSYNSYTNTWHMAEQKRGTKKINSKQLCWNKHTVELWYCTPFAKHRELCWSYP